ncbi:type II toxin-antitoxin system VapC family toxin [Neorhizobium alkalisoli]|uniref:PIN domain-containing protein n=1 Tax=Neorhizobium alkalisoli TaxID=528178 RepID=A0A561QW08_9HYPH|nr:type II toxin-antitoxin system VapC family toxin [Neorhizobium alkalisoli]TWF54564.1 hypothetical protein FHW37_103434 [Neorhizobium alkalisoli]
MARLYKFTKSELETAIVYLSETDSVYLDNAAVASGLSFLRAGGDFADGVIEFEGRRQGGEAFATFDRRAASIVEKQGRKAVLLASD